MKRKFAPVPLVASLALSGTLLANSLPSSPDAGRGDVDSLAGGATTVFDRSKDAFSLPAANLSGARRSAFFVGNSFFNQNWVAAPASTVARDGLGPLFNARSCSACHFKDGRSQPPEEGQPFSTALLRISIPGADHHGAPLPDPVYGDQIQGRSLPGAKAEADVIAKYEAVEGQYADGTPYTLRRPSYRLENLGYGAHGAELATSARVAPAMVGLGLLEAIPEEQIKRAEDPEDRDGNGITGRANTVWNEEVQRTGMGRFGWKAEQPNLRQQIAGAFRGDMGLTTSVFPTENHTTAEEDCLKHPSGGTPEVSDRILHDVLFYTRFLGVPASRNASDPQVTRGRAVFRQLRCDACHQAEWKTGDSPDMPELAQQVIRPYTDLLLHDMGEDLADGRPVFQASGREWRTPPLWGLGLVPTVNGHSTLLHDGRARSFEEAVLWHGGEATSARDGFRALPKEDRAALVAFLESL